MRPEDKKILEDQLITQLAELEREIADLTSQRDGLKNALMRIRRQNLKLRDVTRKNSFDRILVETRIVETLKSAKKSVPTKRLFWEARDINPKLRNTTFRSYIHRLKRKGLIVSGRNHGSWAHPDYASADARGSSSANAKNALA